jgi:purine catabolism regulator
LHRVIRWTHIVDFPDVEPWVRAGDFLLTTAFALKDNPAMQRELIPSLVQKGLSGMAVAIGRYFCEIPPEMTRSADDLAFPILTIPFEIPFVEITQAIHRRIVTEQYDLLEKSFHIHRVLTQLVLQEGDLGAVAESLAKLINRSVTIEDTSFHLLACAAASPEDDVRKQTISEGRTPEPVVTYLTAQGFFDEIRRNPGPRLLPPIPQLGLTLERIIVGAQLYGYVWIIAANNPLAELDFQAIESATIVAALIITRQQTIYETEQRLKDSLLNNLIDPDPYHDIASVIETFQKLGLQYGYRVLVLEQVSDKLLDSSRLCALIEAEMRTTEQRLTVIHREQRFIVLLGATEAAQGKDAAERLLQVTKDEGIALAIGIGSFSRQATHVRQCYSKRRRHCRSAKRFRQVSPASGCLRTWGFYTGCVPCLPICNRTIATMD